MRRTLTLAAGLFLLSTAFGGLDPLTMPAGPGLRPTATLAAQRLVQQRHAYVGVTDASGAPVSGLGPADFLVRENDMAREVVTVGQAPLPSHMVILVDDARLGPLVIEARDALRKFVAGMGMQPAPPQMALMLLADRPSIVVNFTASDIAIDRSLARLVPRPDSGSWLLDGVIDAAKALKKAKATRPAVVALVNDSTPEFSDVLHPRVADALKEIGASLWTVELQTQAPPQNLPARERAALVGDVTGWSGGINRTVLSPQGLVKAFADISAAITGRYDVTYGSPESMIPPSKLAVELRDKTLRLTSPRWPTP